jgi:hypothetical protein
MPYTNVDISREKGPKSFFRKSLGVTKFYEKMGKKNISFLLSFNSELSHFEKNLILTSILITNVFHQLGENR